MSVKRWVRIQATRFTTLPTCAVGAHGNMENRLLGLWAALRIRGNGTELSAAHADTGLLQGAGGVWLGKKDGIGVCCGRADICPALG